MATSPLYNWPEPDNTDLVKNGALAIRTLGNAIDTTMGTMVDKSIVDAKGDLIAATANDTPARLAVGANNYFLQAASGEATGLKWGGAWTSYTPTVTAASGSITTSSASGVHLQIGSFAFAIVQVTITTNGTGGGVLIVSAPHDTSANSSTALWRETNVTGGMGQVQTSGTTFRLTTSGNGYPAANGYGFVFGIGYRVN